MQKFSAYAVEQRSGVEEYAPFKDIQDPHGRELKSWNFKNVFSRSGKVLDFRKNVRGYGKVMEFHFLVQIFCAV